MDATMLAVHEDGVVIQSFELLILIVQVPLDLSDSPHWSTSATKGVHVCIHYTPMPVLFSGNFACRRSEGLGVVWSNN